MVYLDNNATTQMDPAVREAMMPYLGERYGNPSSVHRFGQESRQAVERARHQVAGLVGCEAREVVFTSGGTEANNAAIHGVLANLPVGKRVIVTSAVEHSAVREPLHGLAKLGWTVMEVGVDEKGRLDEGQLAGLLGRGDVGLVSVMWANNETGVVFDVDKIGRMARGAGAVMHVDGVQAAGKMAVGFKGMAVDLLSISGHKFHGPKGVGALVVRRGTRWTGWQKGGPQERDRARGTENVLGIVGMGAAAELAAGRLGEQEGIGRLRDALEKGILERVPETFVNGEVGARLANTTNIGFAGVEAEALLLLLSEQEICASAGAACSSGSLEPSPVLQAMMVPAVVAHGSLRFSLSRWTTKEEVEAVVGMMPGMVERLRRVM